MYMMDNRDVGGDRDCALEVHVWFISWVGSEHILPLHCGAQTGAVAHHLGDTAESLSGRVYQLPACDAHRIGDVKVNCASTSSLCILYWHKSWGTSALEPSYYLHTWFGMLWKLSLSWEYWWNKSEAPTWVHIDLCLTCPFLCCPVGHLLKKSS